MRIRQALAILMLVAVAIAPAAAGAAPSRVPANVLVIGTVISDSVSLDPAQAFEFSTTWVARHLYDTLVDFSRDLSRPVPQLASSWTASADLKTYTFVLRPSKFHSGAPVTAEAVVFSIRRVFALKMAPSSIVTEFIKSPDDVVAIAPNRVRITFNQAMPEVLMTCVLANPVTSVVDPAVVRRNAAPDDPQGNKWLTDHDAGSGPYVLIGWNRNLKIELKAFDEYWRGRPKMGRVFIQDMPEPTTQLLALQQGDIDVAMNLLPAQYKQIAGQSGFRVKTTPTFSIRYLAMNTGFEPFSKVQVRNAIKYALDYEAIKRLYEDTIDPGQTIVPAGMFAHLKDRPYQRNVDRARALMREAGYERGFKAELMVPVGVDPPLPDVAAKMKEDLAQIGIEVDVKVLRNADILAVYRTQKHQLAIQRWGADYPDPDNLAKAFADFDSRVLAWRNLWDHPVKAKVKQAVQERDAARRAALYAEIQKTVLDEGPYAIFAYPLRQIAMRANVTGLDPSPLYQTYEFSNVTK
ncbi:MAG TPA: ABC transporter substrate-binding protein [Thermoanaerobaculia bacterium]|nr:ABC transporter substrate-binding protein [Thermoanaerobaculia bacterium]